MYLVGLTGGIGSGKSTVAARLAELGARVIDADQVAREILEPGSPGLAAVVAHFGDALLTADGRLDRQALADIVFADPEARAALDGITHPRVAERIGALIDEHARRPETDGERIVVVDHPLLVETGQAAAFPAVVVVLAPQEVRVERLVTHRGMDPGDARARIRAQAHDEERRAVATHVITNEGSVAELWAEVDRVFAQLSDAAARARTSA